MTPADRQKLVETLRERLVKLLGPLGIEVEHAAGATKQVVATFTFRVRERKPDGTFGKASELEIHLDAANALQSHNDPGHLEGVSLTWANILADWMPELFEHSELPGATEIDWRPGEALPEDFRAS